MILALLPAAALNSLTLVGGLEGAVLAEAADEARADKLSQELDI
jgi:hypothetical protein